MNKVGVRADAVTPSQLLSLLCSSVTISLPLPPSPAHSFGFRQNGITVLLFLALPLPIADALWDRQEGGGLPADGEGAAPVQVLLQPSLEC